MNPIIDALAQHGFVLVPTELHVDDAWAFVEALMGERPRMVERQPIRPMEGGRSFASTRGFTPLHTDSQDYLGEPPGLQVMTCRRPAATGGETILLDGRALLARIEADDAALHRALFETTREHRFYFGDVTAPTVRRDAAGRCVWTHSPIPASDDVALKFAPWLERAAKKHIAVRAGETLIVDNHRMLHGRTAFEGSEREFLRLLAWMPRPTADILAETRLRIVLEMLTGTPPAKLAAREGLAEPELYAWRTKALAAARDALR